MTPREQAIRERLAKATPGPWRCWNGWPLNTVTDTEDTAVHTIGPDARRGLHAWILGEADRDIYGMKTDMELIAYASTDLAYLLALVARYRTALERCAEGAFVVAERGTLVNVAKQALQEEEPNGSRGH